MSVRTSKRRHARWTPPTIGDQYVRSSDQAVHAIANVYRHDQQVQLKPVDGGRSIYAWAWELDAGWERLSV